MTPTVPPTTASAPVPKLTSASNRTTSRPCRRTARGTAATARTWNISCSPRSSRTRRTRTTPRTPSTPRPNACRCGSVTSASLLRYDLEVDGGDHEVQREQEHERDHDALVDGIADPLRPAAGRHSLVRRDDGRDRAEHQRLDLACYQVRQLAKSLEAREVRTRRPALHDDVEEVAA